MLEPPSTERLVPFRSLYPVMDVHFIVIYFTLFYLTFRKQTAPSRSYFDTAVSALFPVGRHYAFVSSVMLSSRHFFFIFIVFYIIIQLAIMKTVVSIQMIIVSRT